MLFRNEVIRIFFVTMARMLWIYLRIILKDLSFHKKGILLDDILSHAMFTDSDEEHHQRLHTDFTFPGPLDPDREVYKTIHLLGLQ